MPGDQSVAGVVGPVRLVAMDGPFGADILLEQAGSYSL